MAVDCKVLDQIDCNDSGVVSVSDILAAIRKVQSCGYAHEGRITVNEADIQTIYNMLNGLNDLRTRLDGSKLYMTDNGTNP